SRITSKPSGKRSSRGLGYFAISGRAGFLQKERELNIIKLTSNKALSRCLKKTNLSRYVQYKR
nr:hypothetical protein [Candidatus Sigynarchaeota archaeon]